MTYLTRERLFSAQDLDYEDVIVPEWHGETVCLVQMSAGEIQEFTKELEGPAGDDGLFSILVRCLVDNPQDRRRLLTMDDIPALKAKNLDVLNRLQRRALALNHLLSAEEIAKDVAEKKRASLAVAPDALPSGLPSPAAV